jgi:hypothetical protein
MTKPNGAKRARRNLAASLNYGGTAKLTLLDAEGNVVLKDYDDPEQGPVTITLHSVDSDVYQKAQREIVNKRVHRGQANKFEDIQAENIALLAHATLAWDGIAFDPHAGDDDDVPELPCNFENAVLVYTHSPHIREQVHRFINNRANFMPGSSKVSSLSLGTTSGSMARSDKEASSPAGSTSPK